MAENGAPKLKRRIGFWLLTLYGVGVMVGAGVYVLIGQVAGVVGAWTPAAFTLAGLAAAATAASFAELSARMPESAGEATPVGEALVGSGLRDELLARGRAAMATLNADAPGADPGSDSGPRTGSDAGLGSGMGGRR